MKSDNNTQNDQDRGLNPLIAYSKEDLFRKLSLKTEEEWKSPVLASHDHFRSDGTIFKVFFAFKTWHDLLKAIKTTNPAQETNSFYEIIDARSVMYFDVEYYNNDDPYNNSEEVINDIMMFFENFWKKNFGESRHSWYILSSSGDDKRSFHLIHRAGYYLENYLDRFRLFHVFLAFCEDNKAPFLKMPSEKKNQTMCAIDRNVYSKFQSFRCNGCSKLGSTRVLRPVETSVSDERLYFAGFLKDDEVKLDVSKLPLIKKEIMLKDLASTGKTFKCMVESDCVDDIIEFQHAI